MFHSFSMENLPHIRRPPCDCAFYHSGARGIDATYVTTFHVLCRIVPPKMEFLMTHPHRSALVTASPIPAASLHHTTRLAFSPGKPHQSNFRGDQDGPHAYPSPPTSMRRTRTRTGTGHAARGDSGGASTTTYHYTEEVATFWYFLNSRERGCQRGAS